jgi:hypothetical protein
MILRMERAGESRGVGIAGIAGIVLVLTGAAVSAASAASPGFDLGEDLELGQAVHDVEGGPIVAWVAAALLLAVAGMAIVNGQTAARWLTWLGVGAASVTVVCVVVLALAGPDRSAFGAIPFVLAFFSVPALVTGLLLKQPPQRDA